MTDLHHRLDALKKSLGGLPLARTLSGRLLLLTILFVMLAEVLIFVPSIANFRDTWLKERLAAAQIASLALEATMGDEVVEDVEAELLRNAGVLQVSLRRNEKRILILAPEDVPMADASFDLRAASAFTLIVDAFEALFAQNRIIMVKGEPVLSGGELIDVLINESDLQTDMWTYARNIMTLSIIISVLTALLIFVSLRTLLVKPMDHLARNMVEFRKRPEDAGRIITPKSDVAEIRMAEQELADMQSQVHKSLKQKTRLAALGEAVSKINHDLRNILASAQLVSDTLADSDDPKVQRLAPKLVSSIDRAVALATNTLKYGRVEEAPPEKRAVFLSKLVDDVGAQLGLPEGGHIHWQNAVQPDVTVHADADQLFRILLNLGRNAAQAINTQDKADQDHVIEIVARPNAINGSGMLDIDIRDTGPGLPDKAKDHLFEAFTGSARKGGTGLGARHCQGINGSPWGHHRSCAKQFGRLFIPYLFAPPVSGVIIPCFNGMPKHICIMRITAHGRQRI